MTDIFIQQLKSETVAEKLKGQTLGGNFEQGVLRFLEFTFPKLSHLRPGKWNFLKIPRPSGSIFKREIAIAGFEQYEHLTDLRNASAEDHDLAAALGHDYSIVPDVVISREAEPDSEINKTENLVDRSVAKHTGLRLVNNQTPIFHACISCKFTLRSDRAQNARTEALNLIRNRKGKLPHIVVVTAEPLPSRLASLALGTGDIDCVYHFALPELVRAVDEVGAEDAKEMLSILIDGKRLRDISDLPLDLAI